jgi:hypothetical protein
MHDMRRTITEVLEDHGIPAGSSAILAHELKASERLTDASLSAENREELQKQAVAKITKLAYGGAQHLKIKREAMRIWTDAVLDEVVRLKGEWVFPSAITQSPKSRFCAGDQWFSEAMKCTFCRPSSIFGKHFRFQKAR